MRGIPKRTIFFVALFLVICLSALIPTPNNVNGGTAKMFFIIFVTIIFKAALEWIWGRSLENETHPNH